jgi:hypothetical protein
MFEHLYPEKEGAVHYSPLGSYVSFRQRIRERLIAGGVGIFLGLALGAVLFVAGIAS